MFRAIHEGQKPEMVGCVFYRGAPALSKPVAGISSRSQVQEANAAIAGSLPAPTTNYRTSSGDRNPKEVIKISGLIGSVATADLPIRDIDEPTVGI